MTLRTRIKAIARERGMTVRELARHLHLYPSNLSAMDAGTRSVSLRTLGRIAQFLGCGPGDLLEVTWGPETSPFKDRQTEFLMQERDRDAEDGSNRSWVHTVLLNWQRHYKMSGK